MFRLPVHTKKYLFAAVTLLYSVLASKTFDFDTDATPAIGSNGRDVALVWLNACTLQFRLHPAVGLARLVALTLSAAVAAR
jgi:hypothetical protein